MKLPVRFFPSPLLGRLVALALLGAAVVLPARAADEPRRLVFDGVLSEHRLALADLAPGLPSD